MRDVVEKASHCAWQIHYHIVFPVKYRRRLLEEAVVKIIMLTAEEIEERYDIEFEQIGCDKDHVHILCAAHPKIAPGQIVRETLKKCRMVIDLAKYRYLPPSEPTHETDNLCRR